MPDVLDPASMTEAAQRAVDAGDYLHAERLLREAADVQEASLGALHPDLARTLNNLGLVYEQTNKIVEAEQSYRRAHAIAVASLRPGHPFIATSLKNLVDFCEARDIPLWRPPATPVSDELMAFSEEPAGQAPVTSRPVDVPDPTDEMRTPDEATPDVPDVPTAFRYSGAFHVIGLASCVAVGIVVGTLAMRSAGSPSADVAPKPSATTVLPAVPASPAPAAEPPPPAAINTKPEVGPVESPVARLTSALPAAVTVVKAQLCSAIQKQGSPDWQCAEASGDLQPGAYSFYTRVRTNTDITVEHRWFREDRVHQVMRLRIGANPGSGYRAFSRTTVSPERAGNWKVELRAADGSLLHEEHFVVR